MKTFGFWRIAAGLAAFAFSAQVFAAGSLMISEFRLRGPSGANDEFVEIYNGSATAHTVASISGTGYGLAASDGVVRFTIPNGTVIPAHGHYLGVNSVAYSLNGMATGDVTYATDIPDNAGIALFNNNSGGGSFTLVNRIDAVGSTSEANTLYKEGTGYPALTPFSIDYAFTRDACGKDGAITVFTACTVSAPQDTDNNATDFYFDDTNGTSAGAGQRLGAPSPSNLASPINNGTGLTVGSLDPCISQTSAPNVARNFTSDPANNSTFGTLDAGFTFTNNTGAALTALRFHISDISTFPAPSGVADLRARTSSDTTTTVHTTPCGAATTSATVRGTTLVQPPSQPNGAGFDGVMSVPSVTVGTPLANGASVNLHFLFGLQQTGTYKFGFTPEGLPQAGAAAGVIYVTCDTETGCGPAVTIDQAAGQLDPATTSPINFTVVFSTPVTGFTTGDVTLGGTAGATTAVVSGSGTTYNVAVSGMTSNGTVIASLAAGVATDTLGNTNFASTSTDNTVTFAPTGPTVTIDQAAGQVDPATTSPINFTVVFSAPVANFTTGDVTLGGTAGATTAVVTGSGTTYNVAVSGMTGNGTVIASLAVGVATDSFGSASAASTSTDNTVTFAPTGPTVTIDQAAGQVDPATTSPINFTVVFSAPVANFTTGDVTLGGTAGAATAVVSGSGTTYNVAVSGMTGNGTVIASLAAGIASDSFGSASAASTSTDNTVTFAPTGPTVTIDQAAGQIDPATTSPINFTVVFSAPVANFTTGDVTLGGTAGATTAVVSGSGTTYNVAVSGMTGNGTVIASLAAGIASDSFGSASAASTSTDNTVTFAVAAPEPATAVPMLSLTTLLLLALGFVGLARISSKFE